jgi:hypothetical protein
MLKFVSLPALAIAFAASAQSPRTRLAARDTILISRREVTISFALDSTAPLPKPRDRPPPPNLFLVVDRERLSSWLRLTLVEPVSAPIYHDALRPVACQALHDKYSCRDSTTVALANDRLVITIRDSAMLALLFAGRPTEMGLRSDVGQLSWSPAVVLYAAPQLVPPSKEALAEYDRALGRDGWSPWSRTMLTGKSAVLDTVWMQVGERTGAVVVEGQCRPIDSCNKRSDFAASGWTSSDSSVVGLEPSNDPRQTSTTIIALRPGRSTVTVEGLRGPSDDLPRSTRVHMLTQHIAVTNRLVRVQITPRPATIVAGSKFELSAQAIDDAGAVVGDAPVNFYVIYDTPGKNGKRYDLATRVELTKPGHRQFIASFANFADTLDVQVVPRGPPR